MAEHLAGLRRLSWWGDAFGRCLDRDCLGFYTSGTYRAVSKLARAHTRDTGHATQLRADRSVKYTKET